MPKKSNASVAASRDEFHGVRFTHPDRVVYKEQAITKRGLAEYYVAVAERMLPHVVDRPLSLVRCPGGAGGPCFFQKQPPEGLPDSVKRLKIRFQEGESVGVYLEDLEGLLALVQFGVLEIHVWQSHVDRIERPDQIVFDLDPGPEVDWSTVVETAFVVRDLLKELSLESFVKTTGGKGLHILAPIEPSRTWDEVKQFCKGVAGALESADPAHFTLSMSKAARPGKIFVDYLRNERGSTAVAAYSTRSRANAPVSWPLAWKDLRKCPGGDAFRVNNVASLLKKRARDPWADVPDLKQPISDSAVKAVKQWGAAAAAKPPREAQAIPQGAAQRPSSKSGSNGRGRTSKPVRARSRRK